jgi:hypothetical protein
MMLEIPTVIKFDPHNISTKHEKQSTWKSTVVCLSNDDIDAYYASFIRKRYNLELNRPARRAHITIVNDKVPDRKAYLQAKKMFDGKSLVFSFDPEEIRTNGKHWWLKVYCDEAYRIRELAGLTPRPYWGLHLTLGEANEKNIQHSEYIHRQILRFGQ